MLATLAAMKRLLDKGELRINLLFYYEGEAENHSLGFNTAIEAIAEDPVLAATWLPPVDLIFISNKCAHFGAGRELCIGSEDTAFSSSSDGSTLFSLTAQPFFFLQSATGSARSSPV